MIAAPSRTCVRLALLAVVSILATIPLSASLGGDASSVQTDQVRIQGAIMRVTSRDRFQVHEMRAPAGTNVREYVSSAGKVFGVAWDGPVIPDLRQVLGAYFDAYIQAADRRLRKRAGHGPFRIEEPAFVVEQSGHPRAFTGRAYVPQLLPLGVDADVIH
jgi:hypothetical protein